MKKTFAVINALLFALTCALTVYYDREGGLQLKALTGSGFAALGVANLLYAILSKRASLQYPIWTALSLAVCLAGDIVLNIQFLPGVAVFAAGHILYIIAFCCLQKPKAADLIPIGLLFALALGIIKLVPSLDFGPALIENLCIAYGLVISCMVGKAIANFLREPCRVNLFLLLGGVLFYFSDVMLVLCRFGRGGQLADTLCLFSYFPAQCLLAHSVYHHVNRFSVPD